MQIIITLTNIIADLMGCPEECTPEDTECIACRAKAKKYASYIVYIGAAAIILYIAIQLKHLLGK